MFNYFHGTFFKLKNGQKWVLREWWFYFCLRFRHQFFRRTKLGDCVGCFLVYLFFFVWGVGGGGGGESFIKKRGYSWYLKKTHWYPFFNVFWWLKKGYARIFRWLAAKHTTNLVYKIHKTVMHTGVSRFFKSVILVYYMKQGMENVRQSAQWFH